MSTTVEISTSSGCVWKAGEAIWGYNAAKDHLTLRVRQPASYYGLLCLEPRQIGPRGGIKAPAKSAQITASSWQAVREAVRDLGFTMPKLTATEVRRGWEPA